MENNVGSYLTKRSQMNGKSEAYVDSASDLRLTFEELNDRVNRVANMLLDHGIKKGDRVAILMMNSVEFVEVYLATAKIGGVVVPLNWRLVADELEFILRDSGSVVLVYGEEFSELATELYSRGEKTLLKKWFCSKGNNNPEFSIDYESARDEAEASEPAIGAKDDDLLYIMYTSGTTGLPKGVVHTHNTMFWAIATILATAEMREGDRYLAALPMFHVGSLTPITANLYLGGTSVVMREFDPVRAWQLFDEEKITSGLLVPAMLNFMIQVEQKNEFDRSNLRWIQSGASPLPVSLIEKYLEMNIDIHQVYGLTESCGPACLITGADAVEKIGSTGKAFFHTEVRVVDEDGDDVEPSVQGEVWVRGKHIMKEYWNRADATAETITQDGWLRTGDVASVDEQGFVYIQDRIKDMIISGGENVYPAEIENLILSHPQVVEVAVIGQPSNRWGESPFAVIVKNDDALSEEDVLSFCDGKLARFKLPKGVAFFPSLMSYQNRKMPTSEGPKKRLLRVVIEPDSFLFYAGPVQVYILQPTSWMRTYQYYLRHIGDFFI